MTSAFTPAVVALSLIALGAGAMAQTPTAQPPAPQAPTAQLPTGQPPATQPATGQPPATQTPTPQPPAAQTPAVPPATVPAPAGQPPAVQPPAPPMVVSADIDHGTAIMLLDRVATVLDDAVNRKASKSDAVGTSGSDNGPVRVVIDRAALDEIRAEIVQVRSLLKSEPKILNNDPK
jgi:hypothetical protein